MAVPRPTMVGQPIQVPPGLTGRCRRCRFDGDWDGCLVTDGTEIADVAAETAFNGKFHYETGSAAVWLNCPGCGFLVQFAIPDIRL